MLTWYGYTIRLKNRVVRYSFRRMYVSNINLIFRKKRFYHIPFKIVNIFLQKKRVNIVTVRLAEPLLNIYKGRDKL